ncbi:MAG: hypothetical protein A2020_10315 [Lentisphaerae bacterium GWF2_45_14]|nr:MAG: hypothetical protein A2020_10315 [Lentisphaerae bacterium GWF2_45_14]
MKKLLLICVCTVLSCVSELCAQDGVIKESPAQTSAVPEKATLAVLPFIIDESLVITFGGTTLVPRIVETEFSSQILEFLVKSRKFNVLERDHVRRIIDECKLSESEYADPKEIMRIGKLLVADFLVIGYIDRLEFIRKETNIQITGEKSVNWIGTFKIHFRVTDAKTGKIVFAQELKEKIDTRDVKRYMSYDERKDLTLADYKDMLFKSVSELAGNLILEGIYPVKVISAKNGEILLNRGSGAGIRKGFRYGVYNVGEDVTDPDTGESLGAEEIIVAQIEVISAGPKYSKAKVLGGGDKIKPGAICRMVIPERQQDAKPEIPRATPGW